MRADHVSVIRRRQSRRAGFTMLEVTLALVVFLAMTLVFAAAFPVASRQAQSGAYYTQAALLAQHKLDQVNAAGFGVLHSPTAAATGAETLEGLGVVDAGSLSAATVPYSATFTGVDSLAATNGPGSGGFPAGTTGTLSVRDLADVNGGTAPPAGSAPVRAPFGSVYLVTVTVNWPGVGATRQQCRASTLVAKAGGR